MAVAEDFGQALKNFLGLCGSQVRLNYGRRIIDRRKAVRRAHSFDSATKTKPWLLHTMRVRLRQLGSLFNDDCVKRRSACIARP